jgi:hypothetical protein
MLHRIEPYLSHLIHPRIKKPPAASKDEPVVFKKLKIID